MNDVKPYHISVLKNEVIAYLNPKPGGIYVDATFGGGGHTQAILEYQSKAKVIAFDWDAQALEINGEPLKQIYGDRLVLVWGNFAQLDRHLHKLGIRSVDGILADFGTSQFQIHERAGFSFIGDTVLDMRMSPAHQKKTAADIVNFAKEDELVYILKEYGQEYHARAITRAIIQARKAKHIKTTKQLVDIIITIVGSAKKKGIHPATKMFQALRIAVNAELENIRSFLVAAMRILKNKGRLICISFHSLEDRIVKEFFINQVKYVVEKSAILTPKAIFAQPEEIKQNPSSRSARLRALEVHKKE